MFLRTLHCQIVYRTAALLSFLVEVCLQPLIEFVLISFSKTGLSRNIFMLVARTRMKRWSAALIVLVVPCAVLLWNPDAALVLVMAPTVLATILLLPLYMYSQRVLMVSNLGAGKWSVHLNVLKPWEGSDNNSGTATGQWRGAFAELDNLGHMAHDARVEQITFESPLLVNEITTRLLKRKLERTFAKHGITTEVDIGEPKAMGIFGSGLYHGVLKHQRRLKAHRLVYEDALNVKGRKITVSCSLVP